MISLFYRSLRLLLLTIVLIIVWGSFSFQSLPRLEDPPLVSRNAVIQTFFPGASAERVEALITDKIEQELPEIEEIETYESTSRAGSSIISIDLMDSVQGSETSGIWSQIRDAISDVTPLLPPGATEPELEDIKVKAYALIVALTWGAEGEPNYAILRRQAEVLQEQLRALAGTEEVNIFGDPDEEIAVEIDAAQLAALGITAQELSQQIRLSDVETTAGQWRGPDNELAIDVQGELDSLDRIRQIPVRFGQQGQFTFLGDIARIGKGIQQPPTDVAIVDGDPAVVLGTFIEPQRRIDYWNRQAQQMLAKFRTGLPAEIELHTLLEQSDYVDARLRQLIINLVLGALLVFGVTLALMGWQSAIIVGAALPLAMLMVFGWMNLIGISLNQISITGLIVALGILIDTAIVMVDEIKHHLHQGLRPQLAIEHSTRRLAVPLLSSTITTVVAFLPIAMLPGPSGEFIGAIGTNVILAVTSSLVLAFTVVPALTVLLHRQVVRWRAAPPASAWWQTGVSNPKLGNAYRWLLRRTTAQPALGIVLALLLPMAGFMVIPSLDQQFFPPSDRDQLHIQLEMPASTALAETSRQAQRARQRLMTYPEVETVHWFVGRSAPRFYYNLTSQRRNQAFYAEALVQLNTLATPTITKALQSEMDAALPEAQVLVEQLANGPPVPAPIELRIFGTDIQRLQTLGHQVRSQLVQIPGITHVRTDLGEVVPQLALELDEAEARLAGLSLTAIARQLNASLEGAIGGSVLESTEELPVRVRFSNADRGDLGQITALDLQATAPGLAEPQSANGSVAATPLNALGNVDLTPTLSTITRYNGQRVNTVQGFVAADVLWSQVLEAFQQRLDAIELELPPGYRYEYGGEAEERSSAINRLLAPVAVLAVILVATLVLSLQSFRLAAIMGMVAIASFGLGPLAVWLFGYPFGFNPIIGTVGLIGVAINDSIVVLTALKQDPEASQGRRQAVQRVVLRETRHVLTTTFTTMIGFVPLLLGGGKFWPPLAVAIAGGIGGATLLALLLVPSVYLLMVGRDAGAKAVPSQARAYPPA
ncbi:Nodulation protein NolG [Halomicronema hongdechloris C2206]|uniref:Nodulation protein NolG n=1 Tax=Halomicronema hongdechloris C2206 TaxID=1641165 RepID=A0A1Z3HT55_9CYAN|nr:efflux RND transporter permease subunit [Halomicronema hongdechloris]ASC73500.1 Nodulation protein NolG [Halomicronema hongdechloris C2206]